MSRRALEAYENGEKPKSKWTKKAIIAAIRQACDESDLAYDPGVEKMRRDDLFEKFLYNSSWHHTSKFFNETDFYALDEDEVWDTFPEMTEEELAVREERRREARAQAEEKRREAIEWAETRERLSEAYKKEHGFRPDTLAALAYEHPEAVVLRRTRNSKEWVITALIKDTVGKVREHTQLVKYAANSRVVSYNALDGAEGLAAVCDPSPLRAQYRRAKAPGEYESGLRAHFAAMGDDGGDDERCGEIVIVRDEAPVGEGAEEQVR